MKLYNQPTTQVNRIVLSNALLGASGGGGSTKMDVIDNSGTQQSSAMSPARTLYI